VGCWWRPLARPHPHVRLWLGVRHGLGGFEAGAKSNRGTNGTWGGRDVGARIRVRPAWAGLTWLEPDDVRPKSRAADARAYAVWRAGVYS
jgi:hypothetical protein